MDAVVDDDLGDGFSVLAPGQGQLAVHLPVVLQVGLAVLGLLGGDEGQGAVGGQTPVGVAGPAVGDDLGSTMGNIINASYKLMVQTKPDAVLVLGDTNSCLSVIGAKRLHIPIFHMEAGNRCFDECLPEETNRRIVDVISDVNICYSEHARRYLNASGVAKERTYVSGSPMAEVLHDNLDSIKKSNVLEKLGLEKGKYILLSAHREENIDTEKNFVSLFTAINKLAEKYRGGGHAQADAEAER